MKVHRTKRLLIAGVILLLIIVYFLPIPVTTTADITIRLPYAKTLEQVNHLEQWQYWWPDSERGEVIGDTLFRAGNTEYRLDSKELLSIVVTERNKSVYDVVTVIPATYDSVSTVQWKKLSYLKTAVNDCLAAVFGRHAYRPSELLQALKSRLEDPMKYYGFRISVEPIVDTFVLVKNTMVPKDSLQAGVVRTYTLLRRYLDSVHYTGRAERMMYVDSSHPDSVEVIAGYSITRFLEVKSPMRIMTMPKAHIVVGEYEGDYKNIGAIHKAIEAFMQDHRISAVAIEYEKMLSYPRTAKDSMHVRVKVYHPSYIP